MMLFKYIQYSQGLPWRLCVSELSFQMFIVATHLYITGVLGSSRKLCGSQVMFFTGSDWV